MSVASPCGVGEPCGEETLTMMGALRSGFVSFLLAMVAVIGCTFGVRAETPTGAIYITSLPTGADIWVDGTYVGRAPVLVDALSTGHHSVTITKTGWVVQEVDVTVSAGNTAMSSTHLVAGPRALAGDASGSVVFRMVPAGAALEVDGSPLDATSNRPLTLPAGRHRITAKLPHETFSRSIMVLPDMATDVVFSTPKSDSARSAIVAPAEDYLPTDNFSLEGKKIVVRYAGHVVVGYLGDQQVRIDGSPVSYDGAPQSIGGRLYLPLALLEKLAGDMSNDH